MPKCQWHGNGKQKEATARHSATHLRLGRLKEFLNTRQRLMPSWATTSCCTRSVAVAVSASSGTEGKRCLNKERRV